MKRVLCPKCENYLFFDETKYSEGQSLVFECEHCGKQFSIRLGKSKVKALRKEENLEEEAELFGSAYLHKKLEAIDPKTAARIHPNNTKKLIRALEGAASGNPITDFQQCRQKCKDYDAILIGLTRNRDVLYDRINQRVDIMVREGLFKEVENLLEMGLAEEDISMKGIGYKEIIGYFDGLYTEDEAIDLIKKNSRHLAKRNPYNANNQRNPKRDNHSGNSPYANRSLRTDIRKLGTSKCSQPA